MQSATQHTALKARNVNTRSSTASAKECPYAKAVSASTAPSLHNREQTRVGPALPRAKTAAMADLNVATVRGRSSSATTGQISLAAVISDSRLNSRSSAANMCLMSSSG